MPTVAELGARVKSKFPGSYDDIPDSDLGLKIQARHPGSYDDFSPAPPAVPSGPAGLAPSPPPGFGSNLAHSLINFTSPGPTSGPDLQAELRAHPDVNPLNPLHAMGEGLSGIAGTFLHPLDALYQDPIGAANTLGSPIQMLTHPKSLAGVRAAAPDLAKGTAKLGAEYALHKMGPMSEILDLMGALKMGLPGVAQIGRGLRSGFDAARNAPWAVPDISDIFRRAPGAPEPIVDPQAAIELVKDSHGDYVPKGPAAQPQSAAPRPAPSVNPDLIPPVHGPGNRAGTEEFLKRRTLPDLPAAPPSSIPSVSSYPARYQGHPNPTAAWAIDKRVAAHLIRQPGFDPENLTLDQVNTARQATKPPGTKTVKPIKPEDWPTRRAHLRGEFP